MLLTSWKYSLNMNIKLGEMSLLAGNQLIVTSAQYKYRSDTWEKNDHTDPRYYQNDHFIIMLLIHKENSGCYLLCIILIAYTTCRIVDRSLDDVLLERETERANNSHAVIMLNYWLAYAGHSLCTYWSTNNSREASQQTFLITLTPKQRGRSTRLPHLPCPLQSITACHADLASMCVWTANSEADQ